MEMENQVGVSVFTRNCISPKLLHKEDLIRKLRRHSWIIFLCIYYTEYLM